MTLLGILIATVMLALVVRAFAQSYGERRGEARPVDWPDDPRLLTIEEVAAELETTPAEVMHLVQRDAIPHLVVDGIDRSTPDAYRFDRDEISDWVIG